MSTGWMIGFLAVGILLALGVILLAINVGKRIGASFGAVSGMERARVWVAVGFSALMAIAFLVSLSTLVYASVFKPEVKTDIWLNIFLTCFGYVVGIVAGLFGIPAPSAPTSSMTPPPAPPAPPK
jgi:hypothetical protein